MEGLDAGKAFSAVPLSVVVGFWLLGQAYALEVEPLILTIRVITRHHIPVADILAVAVSLFNLVADSRPKGSSP